MFGFGAVATGCFLQLLFPFVMEEADPAVRHFYGLQRILEVKLESELEVAGKVGLGGDLSEGAAVELGIGQTEVDLVEDVEGLRSELHAELVVNRELFDDRGVVVEVDRDANRRPGARHVAQLEAGRECECCRVQVTLRLSIRRAAEAVAVAAAGLRVSRRGRSSGGFQRIASFR
jgi:hypothetical protein